MPFEKDRERRIIFNDDADQQFRRQGGYPYNITDERSFMDARTTPTFDTHVDTYVWCLGNGADPPWGRWGKLRDEVIHPFLGSSERAADLIVDACHAKGMEVWGSLRINDLHDARAETLEQTNDPLKAQHPEYLLGRTGDRDLGTELLESHSWTAFNFERPEVRRYRLEYIKKSAAAHDFDGYELDFTRFIWNFPLGRERELARLMTDFVRQVRSALNTIADKRGRQYTVAAHVMDSAETSLELGQDVEAWLSEGLVDVLVVGMGFMPFTLRLDQWREMDDRYGVPIYPSINTRPLFRLYKERLRRPSAWQQYIRAAAAWWWQSGADGVYLFNLFTHEDDVVGRIDRELVYAPLKEVGVPAELDGKDKLYGIEAGGGSFAQGAEGRGTTHTSRRLRAQAAAEYGAGRRRPQSPLQDSRLDQRRRRRYEGQDAPQPHATRNGVARRPPYGRGASGRHEGWAQRTHGLLRNRAREDGQPDRRARGPDCGHLLTAGASAAGSVGCRLRTAGASMLPRFP